MDADQNADSPQEKPPGPPPAASLEEALERRGIELPPEQRDRLEQFCQLLWQWNGQLNLTRHTTYDLFVNRDIVDTLELAKLIPEGHEVLDVGSGGGVPGVTLAILRPDLQVSLSESVGKKARVLESIVAEMGLTTPLYHARAEDILEDFRFDTLVARAVGPLWKLCKWFEPHGASFAQLLAIKGPRWDEERKEARHRGVTGVLNIRKVADYPVEGMDGDSVILKIVDKRREG